MNTYSIKPTITQAIIGDTKVNAVSARDLHEKLRVKTHVSTWMQRRIAESQLVEGVDFIRLDVSSEERQVKSWGGARTPQVDYIITLDAAKHVAMLERSDIGKAIRQYFINVEKAALEEAQENTRLKAAMEDAQAALMEGLTAKVIDRDGFAPGCSHLHPA